MGKVHHNRRYCSLPCIYKARYLKWGGRITPKQRANYYKKRCLKEGYRERLCQLAKDRNKKLKKFLAEYKLSKGCKDCGYKKHHTALEFDHIKGKKQLNVCLAKSINQAVKEIEKCEVVCSNCHRVRSYNRYHNLGG